MFNKYFVMFAAALLAMAFAAPARADLLFSDDFNGADSSAADYGLNDNLAARQSGLTLVDRTAPLRRAFMRQAAGLSNQTARLLLGQAL